MWSKCPTALSCYVFCSRIGYPRFIMFVKQDVSMLFHPGDDYKESWPHISSVKVGPPPQLCSLPLHVKFLYNMKKSCASLNATDVGLFTFGTLPVYSWCVRKRGSSRKCPCHPSWTSTLCRCCTQCNTLACVVHG